MIASKCGKCVLLFCIEFISNGPSLLPPYTPPPPNPPLLPHIR